MTRFVQITTTVENKGDANTIAAHLLEQRLVACVQISKCTSMYHWQGTLENTDEYVLVMKTKVALFLSVQKILEEIHPYDVPEILATEVITGNASYLEWLEQELL